MQYAQPLKKMYLIVMFMNKVCYYAANVSFACKYRHVQICANIWYLCLFVTVVKPCRRDNIPDTFNLLKTFCFKTFT